MTPYSHRLRVYWEDTDAGGVVFYANYLKFFERARTEWLRSLGFAQQRLRDEHGVMFVVTDASVNYRAAARLDDEIDATVVVTRAGGASITFAQQARRGSTLLAQGSVRIACVDAATLAPRRVPEAIAAATQAAVAACTTTPATAVAAREKAAHTVALPAAIPHATHVTDADQAAA